MHILCPTHLTFPEFVTLISFRVNYKWSSLNSSILGAFAKLRKATISFVMHVRPSVSPSAWNNSASTGRIFIKLHIWPFFENLSRKFKFHYNPTEITGTLNEDVFTFMIISRLILLTKRNVSDKSCRESENTHFMLSCCFSKIASFMR